MCIYVCVYISDSFYTAETNNILKQLQPIKKQTNSNKYTLKKQTFTSYFTLKIQLMKTNPISLPMYLWCWVCSFVCAHTLKSVYIHIHVCVCVCVCVCVYIFPIIYVLEEKGVIEDEMIGWYH